MIALDITHSRRKRERTQICARNEEILTFNERRRKKGTEGRIKGRNRKEEKGRNRREEKGRNRREEKGMKGRKMRGGKNGPECNEDPLSAKCRGPKNV